MERIFVPAVVSDAVRADEKGKPQIWGLPMTLDTMVLFYNQDLLDQAGVPQAPASWAELQEAVVASTRYDSAGNIVQAGGAFGAGKNVDRAADIITALILQNGATMADGRGRAIFNLVAEGQTAEESPAIQALRFYTDFGNPTKQVYTWNGEMEPSLDAFARGKATFFFGYSYHIPLLKARAPKLNYRILQMPQLDPNKPKNVANYWMEAVSKKTKGSKQEAKKANKKITYEKTSRQNTFKEKGSKKSSTSFGCARACAKRENSDNLSKSERNCSIV